MNISNNFTQESLTKIALDVLSHYSINPESINIIQSGSIKTVWKIKTGRKLLCLKRLRQTIDKARFSVNAQLFIKKAGGLVPEVILNKNGQPIEQYNDQLFVLYEWIDGTDLNFADPSDLKLAVQGLAHFHIASKGYIPDAESRVSTKLGKWPEQYTSMKSKLSAWNEIAAANSSQPHYSSYVKCSSQVIRIASQAIDRLNQSNYKQLTSNNSSSIVLCHQDYGKGNALACNNDIYVLDLDSVTFDLPTRDLRKIIGKISENKGQWQSATINNILNWYTEINPLNDDERETLYADMMFPHWFYGLVKNLFQGGKTLKANEIERIAKLEETKIPVLQSF